jgi:hypothetical protein
VKRFALGGAAIAVAGCGAAIALAGCGLNVQSADLFLLTRTGQGATLTMLVNDSGTIRCNNGPSKLLNDQLLLRARDLATALDKDAKKGLQIPAPPASVYTYSIKLQDGTISFPDTAGSHRSELAQAELFATQAAHSPCGAA